MQLGFRLTISTAALLLVTHGVAQAQVLPSTVDSGRTGERIETPAVPQITPAPLKKDAIISLPDVPASEGVVLRGVTLRGATAFDADTLAQLYQDALNKPANLEMLQAIAQRITAKYQPEGYILSKAVVPEQALKSGTAEIAVVEGYVETIRHEEVTKLSDSRGILADIEKQITAMRPLHGPTMESILLRLRDLPGVIITPVIEPLATGNAAPGAVGMALRIERDTVHGSVNLNNYGSRFGGPWQTSAAAQLSPGLVDFDQLKMAALVSLPWDEVQYISGDYDIPLNAQGTRVHVGSSYSGMTPGYTLEPLDVKSDSYDITLGITHPIIRSRAQNLSVNGDLQWKNVATDILGTELYRDNIRAARVGARYDSTDGWNGANLGVITVSQGLPVFGASDSKDTNLSRAEGSGNFTKLEANVSRLQMISTNWQILGVVSGQIASAPLLAAEEFGFGGQSVGRAYDPSEITGDDGVALSLELQYHLQSPWEILSLQPFAFYDIGKVWNQDQFQSDASGSSAGAGLRLWHSGGLNGSIAAAFPLTRDIANPIQGGNGRNPRILFQIGQNF